MKKKKPNYKLRRKIAKIILVLIILTPIIFINRIKIMNATLYLTYHKNSDVVSSMLNIKYSKNEVENTMNYLIKNKRITNNTANYIIKLDDLGYKKETIDYLIRNLNKNQMTDFLSRKYSKDFEEYITLDLFDYKKYERYLAYQKNHKDLSLDDIVTRIELNIDKTYYEDSELIKDPNDITVLANKYLEIPEEYEPADLVDMDDKYANNRYGQKKLRKEAYEQFTKMCDDAKKDDVTFYAESAYRSYSFQNQLYKNYVNEHGQAEADQYAAKPGFSEHELGLAVDLANIWTITTKGEEYAWLKKNAYKYGYIFRYTEEWEDITGYSAESWHMRYVGVEVANKVFKKNMPYEEYYIKYIANKK